MTNTTPTIALTGYKAKQEELRKLKNTVLIHPKEARSQTGAVLRYSDRKYQVMADGSFRRLR